MAKEIAAQLLRIGAVSLAPDAPYTWASGLKSPIYCDNRLTLSYPDVRSHLKHAFAQVVKEHFADTQKIAGIATGAIAHGALLADELNLPFIYIRNKPKEHGKANLIEGKLIAGEKILVIEDLVSTGSSSIPAVEALRQAGCEVLGLVSIFSYGFQKAIDNFKAINCPLFSLSNYETLLEVAFAEKAITSEQRADLQNWYQEPESWSAKAI